MVVDFNTLRHTLDAQSRQADEQLDEVIFGLFSTDPCRQLDATERFHDLIHRDDPSLPLDALVFERGVVPRLVTFVRRDDYPQLQFHALWALVNITVGNADETHAVVDAHAIPELVKLLSSTDPRICDQATWVLANIAGESPQLCDYVLEAGALPALVAYMGRSIGSSAIKAGVWALKNLCKDSLPLTLLHWMTLSPTLHILPAMLELEDHGVLADACSIAACLCNGPVETTQAVLFSGVLNRLLSLSLNRAVVVSLPALTAIAGILRGTTDRQTQALIDVGLLFSLNAALLSTENKMVFMACFALSNIFVGPVRHVQAAIDVGIIKNLILLATESCAKSVKREASWALANAIWTSSSEPPITYYMPAEGCLAPLAAQLRIAENNPHVTSLLRAISSILEVTQHNSEAPVPFTMDSEVTNIIALVVFELQHDDDAELRLLAQHIMQFFHGQTIHDAQLTALASDLASLRIYRRNLELDLSLELQGSLRRLSLV